MSDDPISGIGHVVGDLPDSTKRPPCPIHIFNGKEHPQHCFVLIYLDDTLAEWRCMYCLEYLTRKRIVPGQQKLF